MCWYADANSYAKLMLSLEKYVERGLNSCYELHFMTLAFCVYLLLLIY